MTRFRLDMWSALATLLALGMSATYLSIIERQGGDPALWVVAALLLGAVGAGYGSYTPAPHRRKALVGAAVLLLPLGLLAILTVGLPIIVAGALCIVAATRTAVDAA